MGRLSRVTAHVARRVSFVDGDVTWIEGERGAGPEPVVGEPFPCVLFLPLGTEASDNPRSRKISRPTVMWELLNESTGEPVEVDADDELLITAVDLAGSFDQVEGQPPGTGRWQVDGDPQPFGPPGRAFGAQATVKAVRA